MNIYCIYIRLKEHKNTGTQKAQKRFQAMPRNKTRLETCFTNVLKMSNAKVNIIVSHWLTLRYKTLFLGTLKYLLLNFSV